MTTPTAWAHLPNAALIDKLLAALPTVPDAALGAALGAARGAARVAALGAAWDAAWGAARGAARDAAWVAARGAAWVAARDTARGAAAALVAWDDMPGYIALGDAELEALRAVGADTDVAHKALSAQLYRLLTQHYKEITKTSPPGEKP